MIYVKHVVNKGRGIFASEYIESGTLLSVSYSWVLTPRDLELYDQTSVSGHWFDHPTLAGHGLLPLGLAALVNHSNSPNAVLTWQDSELGCVGHLVSVRHIEADEEITINYGIEMPVGWS